MVLVLILVIAGVLIIAAASFTVVASRRRSRGPRVVEPAPEDLEALDAAVREALTTAPAAPPQAPEATESSAPAVPVAPPAARPALRDRLGRARQLVGGYLEGIRGRSVDDSTFEELEEALILADVGLATTTRVLDDLRARVRTGEIERDSDSLLAALRADLTALFDGDTTTLAIAGNGVGNGTGNGVGNATGALAGPVATSDGEAEPSAEQGPTVWLFVGVNGVGKTTTIGKVAAREREEGRTVVLAAGDTFRAAAGEQLETWADRAGATLIRGSEGADPSSVIFDAVQHAAARGADLVIADTAGRLHTKVNLMDELKKVRRIAERPPGHLTEVLLVLDATTGQNGLVQAKQFTEAVGITGVVLTKLDGTAKGGIVLAIRSELGLPIKLVGVGEGTEDLVEFDPNEFVGALFG